MARSVPPSWRTYCVAGVTLSSASGGAAADVWITEARTTMTKAARASRADLLIYPPLKSRWPAILRAVVGRVNLGLLLLLD